MSGRVPQGITGELMTGAAGEQYYIIGKTRIKITEHFPADRKQIEELITDLISLKTKEKVGKTA